MQPVPDDAGDFGALAGALRPRRSFQNLCRDVGHVGALLCGALRHPSSARPVVYPINVVDVVVIAGPQTTPAS
jgi:hypothetical protein